MSGQTIGGRKQVVTDKHFWLDEKEFMKRVGADLPEGATYDQLDVEHTSDEFPRQIHIRYREWKDLEI